MLRLCVLVSSAVLASACLPQVGPLLDGGAGGGSASGGGTSSGGGGAAASCGNGARDGDETDVDCGGACAPCAVGLQCAAAPDCASGLCTAARCATPTDVCSGFSACPSYLDLTGAGTATIRFPLGGDRYSPPCVRVRFGQTVSFEGSDFGSHPLSQSCGPVANVLERRSGTRFTVTMNAAIGTFGYYCTQHGQRSGSGMAGAIEVVR